MTALPLHPEPTTLDAIARNPAVAAELTPAQASSLLAECSAVHAALVTRVVAGFAGKG